MNKPELLSPAGNMESLKAAVAGGCDAVYLGLQTFSARAFAGNFSHEEMEQAVAYCHFYDVRVYVTMNTMLYESEIDNAMKEVDFLYRIHVDALLIQDLGLFSRIHACYPDFDLHCSTQMHVHNPAGVLFMKQQGARRVVLARETPIEQVSECCKLGIEIEVFVYGAICISYSGQCLMSAAEMNRSGNRGMCAQCCRLRYSAVDQNGNTLNTDGQYLLSPKDLNVIDRIPDLMNAGVSSLKIEGRMKRPEYVYLATHVFREAIDACAEGKKYKVSQQTLEELKLMFNRGFSVGHLFHADTDERMSIRRPNHLGIKIGTVIKYEDGRVLVKLEKDLHQHDGLRILNDPIDTGLTAVKIEKNGLLVSSASAGDEVWLDCRSTPNPKPGQPLQKTSDSVLVEKLAEEISKGRPGIPVAMQYEAAEGKPFHLQINDRCSHSAEAFSQEICQKARTAPLSDEDFQNSLRKTGNTLFTVESVKGTHGNVFLPLKSINQTRRNAFESLQKICEASPLRPEPVSFDYPLIKPDPLPWNHIQISSRRSESEDTLCLKKTDIAPVIHLGQKKGDQYSCTVVSQLGDLTGSLHSCIAGMSFNCANSYAAAFLIHAGTDAVIWSSEMNADQIDASMKAFESRYGWKLKSYAFLQGRRTLMRIQNGFSVYQNQISGIRDQNGQFYPVDYTDSVAEIREPEVHHSEVPEDVGTYEILDKE